MTEYERGAVGISNPPFGRERKEGMYLMMDEMRNRSSDLGEQTRNTESSYLIFERLVIYSFRGIWLITTVLVGRGMGVVVC